MNKTKFISLAASMVLVMVFTLSYDVQAAGQKDFYGVWVSRDINVLDYGIRFCEINKDAITITVINDVVKKSKFRIVKWEKDKDNNSDVINAHTVYALSEDDRKAAFSFWMDAYSDLLINDGFSWLREAMKKSSTAELNKKVQDAKTAEEARIAAKKAEELKAKEAASKLKAEKAASKGTFIDPRDKKTYKTVKIGTQTWMAENLNYDAKGSKCYDNKPANCEKYGRLYNWATAKSACPKGWHLPSESEYRALDDRAVGGSLLAQTGTKLKTKSGWNDYRGSSGNGTDEFDFSALPGGNGGSDGIFYDVGDNGSWWSATEYDANLACYRSMNYYSDGVSRSIHDKDDLYSVRCVQD